MSTIDHSVIVVSPSADDAHASRNSWDHPFRSLSAACRVARDNDTIVVLAGTYLETPTALTAPWDTPQCAAACYLGGKTNVTIQGMGWPTIQFTTHGTGLALDGCTGCTVAGLQFRGQGQILAAGVAFPFALLLFNGINRGHRIMGNRFSASGEHFIAHLSGPRTIFDTLIENCDFTECGSFAPDQSWYDGVAVGVGGSGNIIRGCRFLRCNRAIEFESGSFGPADANAPCQRVLVEGNVIEQSYTQAIIVDPIHHKADLYSDLVFRGNIVRGWGCLPTLPDGRLLSMRQTGFAILGGTGILIEEHLITDIYGTAIDCTASRCDLSHVRVQNNRLARIQNTGISFRTPDYVGAKAAPRNYDLGFCTASDNEVLDCKGRAYWVNGHHCRLIGNVAHNCDWEGFFEEFTGTPWTPTTSGNRFLSNTALDCGGAIGEDGAPVGDVSILSASFQTDSNRVQRINKTSPGK